MMNIKENRGFALVTSLVLLLIVTLIGVSSLRSNILNEKMTRNTLQRQLAFEAAEIALLAGETDVEAFGTRIARDIYDAVINNTSARSTAETCGLAFGGQRGICIPAKYSQNYGVGTGQTLWYERWVEVESDPRSNVDVWSTANRHRQVNESIRNRLGLNTAPRYIIEFMGFLSPDIDDDGDADITASACTAAAPTLPWPFCDQDDKLFRITALGTAGNDDETRVMLQTTYVLQ